MDAFDNDCMGIESEESRDDLKYDEVTEYEEESDNGDASDDENDDENSSDIENNNNNNNDTDGNKHIFMDLEVWEKIGKRLEDFTQEDMLKLSFKDHASCVKFYRMYAKVVGFGIRLKKGPVSEVHQQMTSQLIWCNREGFRAPKHLGRTDRKRKEKPITRCGCKALINFKWNKNTNTWYVTRFEPNHNGHKPVPMNQVPFVRSHREVSEADKLHIKSLISAGVKPSVAMRKFAQTAGGIRNVGFLTQDLYNACEKMKREEVKDGDTETVMAYLMGKKTFDPSFFLEYTRDEEERLDKMFWCDGICQTNYKAFGTVIAFDTTYKVNAYHKPFVVIVGVNHHMKTVPFAVALVSNEKEETYVWVLRQLLKVGDNVAPYTVLTDGDKAMANAIKVVFPNAKHRLCLWHLMRNIKGHSNKRFCSGFMKCVDYCRTPSEFEEAWEELMNAYPLLKERKWAKDLYKDKEKWAEAFMHGDFYAGMRSTQRCESMNSTLKTVLNKKIMLYRFVVSFDGVLDNIRFEEDGDQYMSTHTFPVIGGVLAEIKTEAAKTYTRKAFEVFCKELSYEARHIVIDTKKEKDHVDGESECYLLSDCVKKTTRYLVVHNLKLNRMACCCMKMNSIGFPCRHMFAVMKYKGMVELPRGCVLRRWTILAKSHVTGNNECRDLQRTNDEKSSNARYGFLISLSTQLCRMVSTSYDRSMWLRDKLAKMILDTEREKVFPKKKDVIVETKAKAKEKQRKRKMGVYKADGDTPNKGGNEERGPIQVPLNMGNNYVGFVDLLKQFMPRTYTAGEASSAADCYEISCFKRKPTIFDWDPNNHF